MSKSVTVLPCVNPSLDQLLPLVLLVEILSLQPCANCNRPFKFSKFLAQPCLNRDGAWRVLKPRLEDRSPGLVTSPGCTKGGIRLMHLARGSLFTVPVNTFTTPFFDLFASLHAAQMKARLSCDDHLKSNSSSTSSWRNQV